MKLLKVQLRLFSRPLTQLNVVEDAQDDHSFHFRWEKVDGIFVRHKPTNCEKNYAMRRTIISIASVSAVKGCKVKFKNIVIEWHTAKLRSTLIKLHV